MRKKEEIKIAPKKEFLCEWNPEKLVDGQVKYILSMPNLERTLICEWLKTQIDKLLTGTKYDELKVAEYDEFNKFIADVMGNKKLAHSLTEYIRECVYEDHFLFENEIIENNLLIEKWMKKAGNKAGFHGEWKSRCEGFGWLSLSGEKVFSAEKANDLLEEVLPNCDRTYEIYICGDVLDITCYTHDNPIGYSITVEAGYPF